MVLTFWSVILTALHDRLQNVVAFETCTRDGAVGVERKNHQNMLFHCTGANAQKSRTGLRWSTKRNYRELIEHCRTCTVDMSSIMCCSRFSSLLSFRVSFCKSPCVRPVFAIAV